MHVAGADKDRQDVAGIFHKKTWKHFAIAGGHVSTLSQPETLGIGSSSKVWMCKGANSFKALRGKLERYRFVQISAGWWERVCVSLVWRV